MLYTEFLLTHGALVWLPRILWISQIIFKIRDPDLLKRHFETLFFLHICSSNNFLNLIFIKNLTCLKLQKVQKVIQFEVCVDKCKNGTFKVSASKPDGSRIQFLDLWQL